ncbi:MAG: DUF3107 domain-containing protein [Acidimicrobiia bacterium]|nr:DUF3107 domain-containing protein [Acidimicrobiia bacterium]
MSDITTVRIGLSSARELEITVDDADSIATAFEKAVKGKDSVMWVTDTRGHRFGVNVGSIAFVEIDQPEDRGVGF